MKRPEVYLKEYCQRLSEDNLRYLAERLDLRLSGDVPDALDFLGKSKEIDKWFSTAENCDEFYDMIDIVHGFVMKECERRFGCAEGYILAR